MLMAKKQTSLINEALINEYHGNDYNCTKKVKKSAGRLLDAVITIIIDILKLKETGKYVSISVIFCVLYFFYKFLNTQGYSQEAMQLVIPYLGNLATLVFGTIAGVKGTAKIVEKIINFKNLKNALTNDEKTQ